MTEEEARATIERDHGAAATDRVGHFLQRVIAESQAQNLISPSTIGQIWNRHALDSAQLVPLGNSGTWFDIGTGGGFPGMIVALLRNDPILLIEPRTKRAAFLSQCVDDYGLRHCRVAASKVEQVTGQATTISARAVSSVDTLLNIARHCATPQTRWLLPRGRRHDDDAVALSGKSAMTFHVKQSVTQRESSILVIDGDARP